VPCTHETNIKSDLFGFSVLAAREFAWFNITDLGVHHYQGLDTVRNLGLDGRLSETIVR
jgi:hypothetical protein